MNFDEQWSMPLVNYQPTSSFTTPFPPPPDEPDAGALVSLPCINLNWLKLLLGAADQLRNPSAWDPTLTDAQLNAVLESANRLRQLLSQELACMASVVGASLDNCVLDLQLSDGSTVAVTNWSSQFNTCVVDQIVAPVPPNPRNDMVQQHACNIAGFLAQEVIHQALDAVVSFVGTQNEQVAFAKALINTIGFAFPITNAVANAAYTFYQEVVGQVLAEVQQAASDPVLFAELTCAIYSAIQQLGYVDSSNFAGVDANIRGLSYSLPWVAPTFADFWNNLTLQNIQALQNVGAIDDVDCSQCSTSWCYEWNLTLDPGPFVPQTTEAGHWVSGIGWVSDNADGNTRLALQLAIAHPSPVTRGTIESSCALAAGGFPREEDFQVAPNPPQFWGGFDTNPHGPEIEFHDLAPAQPLTMWFIALESAGFSSADPNVLIRAQLRGTGVNPFGPDNCTF